MHEKDLSALLFIKANEDQYFVNDGWYGYREGSTYGIPVTVSSESLFHVMRCCDINCEDLDFYFYWVIVFLGYLFPCFCSIPHPNSHASQTHTYLLPFSEAWRHFFERTSHHGDIFVMSDRF